MGTSTKSKLTGGTFLLIVIVVVVFGNIGARELTVQLDETHEAVLKNGQAIQQLNLQIELLRKENVELKEQASKVEN